MLAVLINRNDGSLLAGIFYATVWCALGLIPIVAIFNKSDIGFIGWMVHFGFSYYVLKWIDNLTTHKINNKIKEFHEEYDEKIDFGTLIGTSNVRFGFNQEKKLFSLITENEILIKPLDYIRKWQLNWVEVSDDRTISFNNVTMDFTTNDINRPRFVVPLNSKNEGDNLNAKLQILLDA